MIKSLQIFMRILTSEYLWPWLKLNIVSHEMSCCFVVKTMTGRFADYSNYCQQPELNKVSQLGKELLGSFFGQLSFSRFAKTVAFRSSFFLCRPKLYVFAMRKRAFSSASQRLCCFVLLCYAGGSQAIKR